MNNLFIYGNLLKPETLSEALGRDNNLPTQRNAALNNYRKRGNNIIEERGDIVLGALLLVSDSDLSLVEKYIQKDIYSYVAINVSVEVVVNEGSDDEEITEIDAITYQLL